MSEVASEPDAEAKTATDVVDATAERTISHRLPPWLRRPLAHAGEFRAVDALLHELRLATVCREARCPNRGECFASGTATFLVAGDVCTRTCGFCAVEPGAPAAPDPTEPVRVAEAVRRLRLRHAVVTMVTRDDLTDGGASHIVAVIEAIRSAVPGTAVEVLVSDFAGNEQAVELVADAAPDVFNHNLETVPRLYPDVRPGADYDRSLRMLACAKKRRPGMPTKSGLMLGLGERRDEVVAVMKELRSVGCDLLTLGQYLRPSPAHLPVADFVDPAAFVSLAREGRRMGFAGVSSAPFVRSSYHAGELVSGCDGAASSAVIG